MKRHIARFATWMLEMTTVSLATLRLSGASDVPWVLVIAPFAVALIVACCTVLPRKYAKELDGKG